MVDLRVQALVLVSFRVLCHNLSYETSSFFAPCKENFCFYNRRSQGIIAAVLCMSGAATRGMHPRGQLL